MYTLNITSKVENDINGDWLSWQKEEHIPAIMETGCFQTFRFHQLIVQDEGEGKTYVLQLVAGSHEKYREFIDIFEESLKESCFSRWGENYFEFRSLLQNID